MHRNQAPLLLLCFLLASLLPCKAFDNPEWVVFYQAKKYDQALQSIDKYLESGQDEDKKSLLWSRSNLNLALKQYDNAIEDCNKALALAKTDPWTYHLRSMAYAAKHDEKNASADADKAIELSGNDLIYTMNRALVYKMLGNYAKAIQDYSTVIAKEPDCGPAYYFRGELLQNSGKQKEADSDFELAKKHGFKMGEDYLSGSTSK